jgi:ATP-dependent Clp protease, protease subunit
MNGILDMEQKNENFSAADESVRVALLENSIYFLNGEIEEDNVADAIRWIVFENLKGGDQPLVMYVNSVGGSVSDAMALIEIMRKSKRPICTIGIGSVCSSAFLIFASGTKGLRYIADSTSIMCHQFSGEFEGKYHDIKSMMRENDLVNERMLKVLQSCTDLEPRKIKSKLLPPTDVWFTSEEVIELGIADDIF